MSDEDPDFNKMTTEQILDELGVEDVTDRERHGTGLIAGATDANGNPKGVVVDPEPEFDPERLSSGQRWTNGIQTLTLVNLLEPTDELPARWTVVDENGEDSVMAPGAFAGWDLCGHAIEGTTADVDEARADMVIAALGKTLVIFEQMKAQLMQNIGDGARGDFRSVCAGLTIVQQQAGILERGAAAALRVARDLARSSLDELDRVVLASLEPLGDDRSAWVSGIDFVRGVKVMSRTTPPQHAVQVTAALAGLGLVEVQPSTMEDGERRNSRPPSVDPEWPIEFRLTADGWATIGKSAPE